MSACAFTSRLLTSVRRRVCGGASALRAFSAASAAARLQLHREDGASGLTGTVDRFGGVTVDLGEVGLPADISEAAFSRLLQGGTREERKGPFLDSKSTEMMTFKSKSLDRNKILMFSVCFICKDAVNVEKTTQKSILQGFL